MILPNGHAYRKKVSNHTNDHNITTYDTITNNTTIIIDEDKYDSSYSTLNNKNNTTIQYDKSNK